MRPSIKLLVDLVRSLAEQGKTRNEAAKEIGCTYGNIVTLALKYDIEFRRQYKSESPQHQIRAADMRRRFEDGETLEQIGARYEITRERVRQILAKNFGICGRDGGKAETARRKRRARHNLREERAQRVWGCSYADYLRILKHPDKPTYAYWSQQKNAVSRGIPWEITLWQWWKVWEKSGHWAERGRGRAYQMCRLNDSGPYAVDNVYIATGVENMQDYWAKKRSASVLEVAQ